jgi:hypothetical protein
MGSSKHIPFLSDNLLAMGHDVDSPPYTRLMPNEAIMTDT